MNSIIIICRIWFIVCLDNLSQITGLSKPTVAEHIRKAENHIINSLLAGY
ncbi:MAG: helix-turn-helix domain-containing protein [Methanospirillaceae archaeon]|nr:helix-turn-helix domain-containing protein [Methanospirillaceae archaeon]